MRSGLTRRANHSPSSLSIISDFFGSDHFESALDDSFKQLFNQVLGNQNRFYSVFKGKVEYPKADVYTKDNSLCFKLAVPGIKQEDIDISLEESEKNTYLLTIKGNHKKESISQSYLTELRSGSFERSWSIPLNIIKDEISASLDNGLLEVTIPIITEKKPEKETKKIQINAQKTKIA
jgi:HSP20 family protein